MNNALPLQKKVILITRPKHQAQTLTRALQKLGADILLFPTIDILPLQDTSLEQPFKNIDDDTLLIFVSANAVQHSMPYWNHLNQNVFAIGPATAQALKNAGVTHVNIPDTYSSEGLLQHPQLQCCTDKKIMIICGKPSRPLLRDTLLQRGAEVSQTPCYQQQLPSLDTLPPIASLKQRGIDIIISTSQRGLSHLYQLIDPANHHWLNQHQFLVIHEKMQKSLQKFGNSEPSLLAKNATDQAIAECLYEHFHKR